MPLEIGAASDIVGQELYRSPHCVVPTLRDGATGAIKRHTRQEGTHVEHLVFRERLAWLFEIAPWRQSQRDHARREKRPSVDECIKLCVESSRLLSYRIQPRVDALKTRTLQTENPGSAESVKAYQWYQRWLREELVRLRVNAALWLAEHADCRIQRVVMVLGPQALWEDSSLSNYELCFAVRIENVAPVLQLEVQRYQIAVALPWLPREWTERINTVAGVRNTRTGAVASAHLTSRMEQVMERLWAYIPEQPGIELLGVGPASMMYPTDEHLDRDLRGLRDAMEPWVRERLREKRTLLAALKTPAEKRSRKRKTSMLPAADLDDINLDDLYS